MFEIYRCEQGDSVDLIAFKRFGTHGMESAILDANPGLAARGPVLPLGLEVKIPVPLMETRKAGHNLWGTSE